MTLKFVEASLQSFYALMVRSVRDENFRNITPKTASERELVHHRELAVLIKFKKSEDFFVTACISPALLCKSLIAGLTTWHIDDSH